MRFLIDNALSEIVSEGLVAAGHDAVHVRDLAMQDADDDPILEFAARECRIIVSADTDFGTILALSRSPGPSVIQFRKHTERRPEVQLKLLLLNLEKVRAALDAGSVVTIEYGRIRVRRLPIADLQEDADEEAQ